MDRTARKRCAKCGKRLKKGGSFYVLKAELISSFDGYIPDDNIELGEKIREIEDEVERLSEEKLAEQVYKKFEYYVCPECRDDIDEFLKTEDDK